ncbi:hypothetical protein K438DRAFT_1627213, partial [Mycena galopus ATCC 62051]
LSPINFFLRHADISQMRVKGTGGWLLADPVFKKWESNSGSTLWCRGIPGAGKTVLALVTNNYDNPRSMVVDHLSAKFRNNKDIGVACIYLNYKEADQQTPPKLLAALWRQLVLDRDIDSSAENLYKKHCEKGTAPSLEEVVNVLTSSLCQGKHPSVRPSVRPAPAHRTAPLPRPILRPASSVHLSSPDHPAFGPMPQPTPPSGTSPSAPPDSDPPRPPASGRSHWHVLCDQARDHCRSIRTRATG